MTYDELELRLKASNAYKEAYLECYDKCERSKYSEGYLEKCRNALDDTLDQLLDSRPFDEVEGDFEWHLAGLLGRLNAYRSKIWEQRTGRKSELSIVMAMGDRKAA